VMYLLIKSRRKTLCGWFCFLMSVVLCLAQGHMSVQVQGQTPGELHPMDIGIIVSSSNSEAELVLKQLRAGQDFFVLAKEKSTDATAIDGGYMGRLNPAQLRAELRDALAGHQVGQLTSVVQLPSGFAILKVLSAPPPGDSPNAKRISALMGNSTIHWGASVAGLVEADAAFGDYEKPKGWDHDLQQVCELRKKSLSSAISTLNRFSDPNDPSLAAAGSQVDLGTVHSTLAQIHAYNGDMEKSIAEWKTAYQLASTDTPGRLPNLEESLGVSYLHLSEMENGAYRDSSDLDIFPPIRPHASYKRTNESKQAIQYFLKYLEGRPDDLEVKWLLNLSYMTLGQYPSGVPAAYRILESDFQSKESIGRFVDVAPAAGLNIFRQAGGVIVDDFDNDGLLDVMVSSNNVCDPLHYFHNNGDGTFSDRSEQAGVLGQLGGLNLVQTDYNNDGCMDLLVLRGGWEFPERKSLLRNNCNGTFSDVTKESGLEASITATQTAVWADIDNDGNLDLFVGNENSPAQLYHNNGDGTFTEIGVSSGIAETAFAKGVTAADYDHDGYVDLYLSNRGGENRLYHNNGNLTFTEVARQAGVQSPAYGFATWFFDYDNDGWPDLFAVGYLPAIDETLNTYVGRPHNAETLKLYRNKHDGTFEDVTAKVGLDKVFMPMGSNFGDVDNDGYLDIYLGSGQPSFTALLPHVLLRNKEGKSFVDITQSSGTGELHKGHGIAFADLSRRGVQDIVAQIGGAIPSDAHAMRVFENPGNDNDWLNVRLVGVKSTRSAVGAEIHVTVQDGTETPRSIYRTVGGNSSFGGNPLEQHIGLGHNAHVTALDIFWPATGTQQHFAGIGKNQYIEIKEFATTYAKLERHPFRIGGSASSTMSVASAHSRVKLTPAPATQSERDDK